MDFDEKMKAHSLAVIDAKIEELNELLNIVKLPSVIEHINNRLATWHRVRAKEQGVGDE